MAKRRSQPTTREIRRWQALIQQVVMLAARGYSYVQVLALPEHKRDRWPAIHERLARKFAAKQTERQRYRRKGRGLANYFVLRWEHLVVILRTEGRTDPEVEQGERWTDLRCRPVRLAVGPYMALTLSRASGRCHVQMDPVTYRAEKDLLGEAARLRDVRRVLWILRRMNGLPGYAGINEQRETLRKFAKRELGRQGIRLPETPRRWGRPVEKVWADPEDDGSGDPTA